MNSIFEILTKLLLLRFKYLIYNVIDALDEGIKIENFDPYLFLKKFSILSILFLSNVLLFLKVTFFARGPLNVFHILF